jgi:alpha-beta hydrolase superfamily lysophospholipase
LDLPFRHLLHGPAHLIFDVNTTMLDSRLLASIIFFPREIRAAATFSVDVGGDVIGCHVQRPFPDAGMVVYFHGNAESAAECDEYLADFFLDMGVNVCFVEYRGYGRSSGRPLLTGMLGDGEKVVAKLGVPAEKIVVFGRSLGSVYAVELARRLPNIAGLVLESGIANLMDLSPPALMLGPIGRAIASPLRLAVPSLNQRAKMRRYRGPLLVMHTVHDRIIHVSHGKRLHAWAASKDKRLELFAAGDHNSVMEENAAVYTRAVGDLVRASGVAG